MDSSTFILRSGPFPIQGVSDQFLLLPSFIEIPVLNVNSEDPDQTPRSAASDLGLHCLPVSLLWDARHKLVSVVIPGKGGDPVFVGFTHDIIQNFNMSRDTAFPKRLSVRPAKTQISLRIRGV